MIDDELQRSLRSWYAAEIGVAEPAPQSLHTSIAAIPQGEPMRGVSGRRGVWLLAAAALLVGLLAGAIAVAAALLKLPAVLPAPSLPPAILETVPPSSSPAASAPPTFLVGPAGSLGEGRFSHVAIALPDGRVFVAGGSGPHEPHAQNYLGSTEIWDPERNSFSPSGRLSEAAINSDSLLRTSQFALLLTDGRVLIVPGGCACSPMPTAHGELWDPTTGSSRMLAGLALARTGHSATLLADGRVLIAGGLADPFTGSTAPAEIWDPATEQILPSGPMAVDRAGHSATLLADGRVLIVGGGRPLAGSGGYEAVPTAEVWDPVAASFSRVPALEGVQGEAITLPDGNVLLLPRSAMPEFGGEASKALLWDPASGRVRPAGSLNVPRQSYTATLLPDGRVLVVGGIERLGPDDPVEPVLSIELWDPATRTFSEAGTLTYPRQGHTATALPDGRVLIVGGLHGEFAGSPFAEAEVWERTDGS